MKKILVFMVLALTTITLVSCGAFFVNEKVDEEVTVVVVGYDSVEKFDDKKSNVIEYLIVKIKYQDKKYYLEVKEPSLWIVGDWKEKHYPIGKEMITNTKNLKEVEE